MVVVGSRYSCSIVAFLSALLLIAGCAPVHKEETLETGSGLHKWNRKFSFNPDIVVPMEPKETLAGVVFPEMWAADKKEISIRLDIKFEEQGTSEVLWVFLLCDGMKKRLMRARVAGGVAGQYCFRDCGTGKSKKDSLSIFVKTPVRPKREYNFEIALLTPEKQIALLKKRLIIYVLPSDKMGDNPTKIVK